MHPRGKGSTNIISGKKRYPLICLIAGRGIFAITQLELLILNKGLHARVYDDFN
jgi:hypothetical protein